MLHNFFCVLNLLKICLNFLNNNLRKHLYASFVLFRFDYSDIYCLCLDQVDVHRTHKVQDY